MKTSDDLQKNEYGNTGRIHRSNRASTKSVDKVTSVLNQEVVRDDS